MPPLVTRPLRRRPQPEHPLQRQRAADAEQQHQAARLQAAPAHRMGLPVRVAPGGGGQHGEGGAGSVPAPPVCGTPADGSPAPPRFVTLRPGDVLLTGTPPGVGVFRKPPVFLKVSTGWGGSKQGQEGWGGPPPIRSNTLRALHLPPPIPSHRPTQRPKFPPPRLPAHAGGGDPPLAALPTHPTPHSPWGTHPWGPGAPTLPP